MMLKNLLLLKWCVIHVGLCRFVQYQVRTCSSRNSTDSCLHHSSFYHPHARTGDRSSWPSSSASTCSAAPLLHRCSTWREEATLPLQWRQPPVSFHSSEYFWWSLCLLVFTVTTLIKELGYRHRTVRPVCLSSQKNSFSCQIVVLLHYLFLCVCFHW